MEQEYQLNQERKAAKQNTLTEIDRCCRRMEDKTRNKNTLMDDFSKEYQEDELTKKLKSQKSASLNFNWIFQKLFYTHQESHRFFAINDSVVIR